jgi:hypothetical protein
MYNLLVTFTKNAWNEGAYEFQLGRAIGGYGDASVSDQYKDFAPEAIAKLKSFPSLFMYEDGVSDEVHLGWIRAIIRRSTTVRIEFELEKGLPKLSHGEIAKHKAALDIGGGALSHTHWAVKDIELIPALIRAGLLSESVIKKKGRDSRLFQNALTRPVSEVYIQPTVFRVPSGPVEDDLVSVMMPFDASYTSVFRAIKSACKENELRCQRADDIWGEAEIIQDVFSLIYRSRIVVCDFSDRNPNVFYEAGIAHTLGKTVVPIFQSKNDIPFDVAHMRAVKYLNNREGLRKLKGALSTKLNSVVTA